MRQAVVLGLMTLGILGCSSGPQCSDRAVQQALRGALDEVYAEVRQIGDVDYTVQEIVSVESRPNRAVCKAVIYVKVNVLNIQKPEGQATVPYVADVTDSGRILVTIDERFR